MNIQRYIARITVLLATLLMLNASNVWMPTSSKMVY